MSAAERIIATTLLGIVVTAVVVLTGHTPPIAQPIILGWLAILAVCAYGAYLVSEFDQSNM